MTHATMKALLCLGKPSALHSVSTTTRPIPGPPALHACLQFSEVAVTPSAARQPAGLHREPPATARCRLPTTRVSMNARVPASFSPPPPTPTTVPASVTPREARLVYPGSSRSASPGLLADSTASSRAYRSPQTPAGRATTTEERGGVSDKQHAIPWKKRSLRHNFHSIEDLVRPGDSYSSPGDTGLPPPRRSMISQDVSAASPCAPRIREERRAGAGSPPLHHPAPVCLTKCASDDDDIDVVDTVERRLSPLPHIVTPSSSCQAYPHTPPDSSTASPSTHLPGDPGARSPPPREGSCHSPGGGAPTTSNSSGGAAGDAESADPNRLRKGRTIYKAQQVYILEQVFSRTHYPDPEVIETLSRELDISENKIKVWFQNKRARWRRRAAETGLPPQPIGFTLTGTPGVSASWPHPASLPAGVLMPQPVYTSPFAGTQVAPRPGFPTVAPFPTLSTPPLYLSFDSSMLHAASKGLSHPSMLPYSGYPMTTLPSHVWSESSKLPGT